MVDNCHPFLMVKETKSDELPHLTVSNKQQS